MPSARTCTGDPDADAHLVSGGGGASGEERRVGPGAHLEGQVGGDGDAGAQVHVAVPVADEQRGAALGLCPHRDAAAVVRPRPQPACNGSSRGQRARASDGETRRAGTLFHAGLDTNPIFLMYHFQV